MLIPHKVIDLDLSTLGKMINESLEFLANEPLIFALVVKTESNTHMVCNCGADNALHIIRGLTRRKKPMPKKIQKQPVMLEGV